MSIQTELTRLTNAKSAIKSAIEGKGVTVPDATLLDGMAALIASIEAGGGGTPCLAYTFTPANDILDGSYEIGDAPLSELDYYLIQTISSRTPSGRGYICIGTSGKVTNTKDGYTSWYRYTSSAYGTTFFEKKFVTSAKYSDRTGVYIENGKLYLLTYYYNLPAGSTTTIICGCI